MVEVGYFGGRGELSAVGQRQRVALFRRSRRWRGDDSTGKGRANGSGKGYGSREPRPLYGRAWSLERPRGGWFVDVCPRQKHARGVSAEPGTAVRIARTSHHEWRNLLPAVEDRSGLVLLLSAAAILIFVVIGFLSVAAAAQSYEPNGERKVVTRVDPEYPEALKKLYIGGIVRVEVVVLPSGSVKSTRLMGGSPILGQSTMKAIKMWKYAPGAEQTVTEKVEFDPHR